jgi:hypothetical protein
MPFDAYKQYLSLKNHFTKEKYDYQSIVERVVQPFSLSTKGKIVSGLRN